MNWKRVDAENDDWMKRHWLKRGSDQKGKLDDEKDKRDGLTRGWGTEGEKQVNIESGRKEIR